MERYIIENRTDKSLSEILQYIKTVASGGKISNKGKQHCYSTVFNDGVFVSSFLNEKSERLVISKQGSGN